MKKLFSACTRLVGERYTQLYYITDDQGQAIQLHPCFLLSVVQDDGTITAIDGPSRGTKNIAYGHALYAYMNQASFRHMPSNDIPRIVRNQPATLLLGGQVVGWEVAEVPDDFLQKAHETATRRSQPPPIRQASPPALRALAKPKVQHPSVMKYMLTIGALVAIAIAF